MRVYVRYVLHIAWWCYTKHLYNYNNALHAIFFTFDKIFTFNSAISDGENLTAHRVFAAVEQWHKAQ